MLIDAPGRKLTANLRRRKASPAINSGQRATPLTQQTQAVASSGPGHPSHLYYISTHPAPIGNQQEE
ncbi:hypothetical protein [Pseudomonas sp. LF245]